MGGFQSKDRSHPSEKAVEGLKYKIKLLQAEIHDIMSIRENENQAYEQEMMVFAFKEAEWKREKKRLREEVKKLKKKLEEKAEKARVENEMLDEKNDKGLQLLGSSYLLEQIREEQSRRDETVEKWKQLYFEIKFELDDLIQRTNQGGLCWKAGEEDLIMELQKELKSKEETIEHLQDKVALMELQESQMAREIDILKQSLRIISHRRKKAADLKSLSRSLHL